MRLAVEALRQCRGEARFAEAGFARDRHDLSVPALVRAQRRTDFMKFAARHRFCGLPHEKPRRVTDPPEACKKEPPRV
jgi:hypothetical protein